MNAGCDVSDNYKKIRFGNGLKGKNIYRAWNKKIMMNELHLQQKAS